MEINQHCDHEGRLNVPRRFGWFGFNGGSALAADEVAAYALINTEISASVALIVWMAIEWVFEGKPSLVGVCVGAIAGLATITPAAGFVKPWAAVVIGAAGAIVCYVCVKLVTKLGLDDALDVWGVHGMGGFLGTVLLCVEIKFRVPHAIDAMLSS